MESPCAHNRRMRSPAWGALLVVVGCARTPAPVAVPSAPLETPPLPVVTAIWDVEHADPASREVRLFFVAAACSAVQRVEVEESADRVVITLDQEGREGKDCTEPLLRHRLVTLREPLGDRELYDGGAAPPVRVPYRNNTVAFRNSTG